jgi:hypothetical protein
MRTPEIPRSRILKSLKKKKKMNCSIARRIQTYIQIKGLEGCIFATTVSQTIIKVKESFSDGFVKKSKK